MAHHLDILEFKLDSDRLGGVLEFPPEKGVIMWYVQMEAWK